MHLLIIILIILKILRCLKIAACEHNEFQNVTECFEWNVKYKTESSYSISLAYTKCMNIYGVCFSVLCNKYFIRQFCPPLWNLWMERHCVSVDIVKREVDSHIMLRCFSGYTTKNIENFVYLQLYSIRMFSLQAAWSWSVVHGLVLHFTDYGDILCQINIYKS